MITLAEAIKLKSILRQKEQSIIYRMQDVAFDTVVNGETLSSTSVTLEQLEQQLERIQRDARTIDRLMYEANSTETITFDNETIPLVEAIEWAKQIRTNLQWMQQFAQSEKESLIGVNEAGTTLHRAKFDPETYEQKVEHLERQAHKLSNLINAKNYTVTLPFDDTLYFG